MKDKKKKGDKQIKYKVINVLSIRRKTKIKDFLETK